jgi:hypothetical protein
LRVPQTLALDLAGREDPLLPRHCRPVYAMTGPALIRYDDVTPLEYDPTR